jgi:signal transduction histidine kinase
MIRRRVAVQLVLLLLAVSLLPLGGAGVILLKQTQDRLEADLAADHERLARVARVLASDYLDGNKAKVQAIARVVQESSAADREALAARLKDLLLPADSIVGLHWIADNREMALVVQEPPSQQKQIESVANRNAFRQRAAPQSAPELSYENLNFSNRRMNEVGPLQVLNDWNLNPATRTLAVAAGIDARNRLIGQLSLEPLSLALEGLTQGSGRELVLLDRAGAVLAASSAELHPEWRTSRHPGPEGWSLLVREPAEAAFAPLREARGQMLLWLGIAAALAVGLSFLFAAWILRPVRALTGAAGALERGDLSARTGIRRADEIGLLAAAFDRMAAAVQSLDRARSEFVATVSHELRTPLTSIKCTVENIADGVAGPDALGRAREDLDRLIRLVNELLGLARLGAGEPLRREPVDLRRIAAEAAAALEPLARRRRVALRIEGEASPASGDPARLHEVFTNLIDNAIKFSPEGGCVRIAVKPGLFAVSDDGPGVPADKREALFVPFGAGGGLGLSIARRIVELHGGSIGVEGSTFSVRL